MNAALKQAAWLFCTLITLGFSGWYFASAPVKIQLDENALAKIPDTIIQGLRVRQFNEQGQLIQLLEAKKLKHIPEQDTNKMQSPHIVVIEEKPPAWEIRANKAIATDKWEQIVFNQHVIVHQDAGDKTEESTLKTKTLTYFPKKKFATTEARVYFKQPGRTVRGQGMNAYLENKRIELLNNAQVTYEPPSKEN